MDSQSQPKRKYELKRRADEMARTRRRIAEAAVELHGTVGPARTTLTAVAERAGVQRHTVYRHFPTEAELFGACSAHWVAANPLPDREPWWAISDPRRRLATALNELYAYYERTEPMLSNVLRDAELVEALRPTLAPMQAFLAETAEILTAGWGARGQRRRVLKHAIAHAIDFHTWRSLTAGGEITRTEAVNLVSALVQAAATRRRRAAA
jgi:AcrR family transcriptional regulator